MVKTSPTNVLDGLPKSKFQGLEVQTNFASFCPKKAEVVDGQMWTGSPGQMVCEHASANINLKVVSLDRYALECVLPLG